MLSLEVENLLQPQYKHYPFSLAMHLSGYFMKFKYTISIIFMPSLLEAYGLTTTLTTLIVMPEHARLC